MGAVLLALTGCGVMDGREHHLPSWRFVDEVDDAVMPPLTTASQLPYKEPEAQPTPIAPFEEAAPEISAAPAAVSAAAPNTAIDPAAPDRLAMEDPATFFALRGNAFFNDKAYLRALVAYENGLAIKPDHGEMLLMQGACLHMLRRYEEAVAAYDKLLAHNGVSARAYYNRGNSLAALGQLKAAEADYTRALALEPEHAPALANRAFVREAMGQHDAASKDAARARALDDAVNLPVASQ